jgi:hypothetical protein
MSSRTSRVSGAAAVIPGQAEGLSPEPMNTRYETTFAIAERRSRQLSC